GMGELAEDLEAAGLQGRIKPSYLFWENKLLKDRSLERKDAAACEQLDRNAPQFVKDSAAQYYEVNATGKEREIRVPARGSLEALYMQQVKGQAGEVQFPRGWV